MEKSPELAADEFRAAWRSTVGWLVLFLALFGLSLAVAAWLTGYWAYWAGALLFAGSAALLGGQFRSRFPVLRVDAQGVGSHWLKGRTIPWAEIVDVQSALVQGHPQLILHLVDGAASLAPTARLLGERKPIRRIPLGALTRGEDVKAVGAAMRAFLRHGGAQAGVAHREHEDAVTAQAQFEVRLKTLTPVPWALYLMVALNVGVWLVQVATGISPLSPQSSELFDWGANSAWAVAQDGQLWRLASAAFLHGGLMHLCLNMLGLCSAGLLLNRIYGNAQFLIIYLVSAVAGNALSLHFSAQQSVSVGASGAVFGVLGALLVALMQHGKQLPSAMRQNLLVSQAVFIVTSLAQGFARTGIDNAAHIGGLVAGGACAWLLVERLDARATAATRRHRALLAVALGGVAVGLLVRAVGMPPIDHARAFQAQRGLQAGGRALQEAEVALQRDLQAHREGRLSEAEVLAAVQDRHLPAYRASRDAFAVLSLPASDPQSAVLADVQRLSALAVEVLELEQRKNAPGADVANLDATFRARMQETQALRERLKARRQQNKAR